MSNLTTTPWTEGKIAELIRLRDEGFSSQEIADRLGREFTRNSVIGKVFRLKLAPRKVEVREARAGAPKRKLVPRQKAQTPSGTARVTIGNSRAYAVTDPKPLPVFEEVEAPDVSVLFCTVAFLERGQDQCAAIVSEEPTLCCGQPVGLTWKGEKSSYCQAHHARYFIPPAKPNASRPHYRRGRA